MKKRKIFSQRGEKESYREELESEENRSRWPMFGTDFVSLVKAERRGE